MLKRLRAAWRDLEANPRLNATERKVMYAGLVVGALIGLGGFVLIVIHWGDDRDVMEALAVIVIAVALLTLAVLGPVVKHWGRRP